MVHPTQKTYSEISEKLSTSVPKNLVAFCLEAQVYAISIDTVLQIIEMVTIIPVPKLSSEVEGVINVHGEAVPVINLRCYLELPQADLHLHTPMILVRIEEADVPKGVRTLALIVDEVLGVIAPQDEHITSIPNVLPDFLRRAQIVQGLVQSDQGMAILLDPDQLFSTVQDEALNLNATLSRA